MKSLGDKYQLRVHRHTIRPISLRNEFIGGGAPLCLIAGPCVVEDYGICMEIIHEAQRLCDLFGVTYIFKASYDKANKTIKDSYRGPGWEKGLNELQKIKADTNTYILTDVHEKEQCADVAQVADILQIPALLSKQIDLIIAAAKTGKIINVKKGQFTAPWEINNILARLADEGITDVMVTDRGYLFGYQMLISDMRGLQIMSQFGAPVIFDASHSVHGADLITHGTSLKQRDFICPLIRSAVANGVDGIFVEVHPEPEKALSDPVGTLSLSNLEQLIKEMTRVDSALNEEHI